ncbi:MAG: methionine gamma-lyase family protein [Oscillospiraceae bacterium]
MMSFDMFGLGEKYNELDKRLMSKCAVQFAKIDAVRDVNQLKMLNAFTKNRVGAQHFAASTGYGYGDVGRDMLDRVFADAVGAQSAICRAQFMSGTHALTVALFGVLRFGDTLMAVTGRPYDTLSDVIFKSEKSLGSLGDFGVHYAQIDMLGDEPDYKKIAESSSTAKVIYIQRSRGYSARKALTVDEIGKIARTAKEANRDAVVMVDNCYGEFTDTTEPIEHGADLIIGSLIKNPGGAIAETGGYIAGKKELVELCANRLTAPGTGAEIGSFPTGYRNMFLGLYMAPEITATALKSAVYGAALFEELGLAASPRYDEKRSDIVTCVVMDSQQQLLELCRAVQSASPIDSFAVPEAWEMPGYESKVVMASGAFTCGSSIELSCDAPIREPYTAYIQGGISLTAARFAYLKFAAGSGLF